LSRYNSNENNTVRHYDADSNNNYYCYYYKYYYKYYYYCYYYNYYYKYYYYYYYYYSSLGEISL